MGVDKQRNNAVRKAGRDRRSQPPVGPSRLICGKGSPARPKGGIGTLRRHGHLGLLHPQQNEASDEAQQAYEYEPGEGAVPSSLPSRHGHASYSWNAPTQALPRFRRLPAHFASLKRVVVPDAFRVTRLRPGRKFSSLGKLAVDLGWGYQDVLTEYEEKRKGKAAAYYAKSKAKKVAIAKAKAANQ